MPTIEIVSINSAGLGLNQSDYDVAIIEENILRSHRALFYDILQRQTGVIVHIGNPEYKDLKDFGFFAGEIVDWSVEPNGSITIPVYDPQEAVQESGANQQFIFKFLDQFKSDINLLLMTALEKSPIKRICLLTDYQFGPEIARTETVFTIKDFWKLHDSYGLTFNTMYEMFGE